MSTGTINLASTTFTQPVLAGDTIVYLASTAGIVRNSVLYAGAEAFDVEYIDGINSGVHVRRGYEGTATRAHSPLETVWIALPSQLYQSDPVGVPPLGVYVLPHINVLNGNVWTVQGNESGDGAQDRSWQLVTNIQYPGPLGVRQYNLTTPV
jgi:hypothetical protein